MDPSWQEGAGGLLLLAAAHETGLLTALTSALPTATENTPPRLARMRLPTQQSLLLTLLFLAVVGLKRTWDLRHYVGEGLAFLTGRAHAYSYPMVERFLAEVAQAGAAQVLTEALARWTQHLWQPEGAPSSEARFYYIDGHRKPVYSDQTLPRGLIGRTGAIEGCRALVLLHDEHGHPLLATTHRGDQHLMRGLPQIVARYAEATDQGLLQQIVVDREGMGGDFLAGLVAAGHTVITLLRTDQYEGLTSFTEVGPFVPLSVDRHGVVVREVAPACFALPIPSRPGESLPLSVALIRDLRCARPAPPAADEEEDVWQWIAPAQRWLADLPPEARQWWEESWVATPAPTGPTQPKLIPIVTTAATRDCLTLAHRYIARWPRQENVIRDFLLPLGLDTNHGYAKTAVEHSEFAKQRTRLEQRRDRLARWAQGARDRYRRAETRAEKRRRHYNQEADRLARELGQHQTVLERQEAGVLSPTSRRCLREHQDEIKLYLASLNQGYWRAVHERDAEWRKLERYCQEQRTLLRTLADLNARVQQMYELNNDKDQVMTVCKVALTNLVMWTRDHYFPETYAQATWARLAPFFQLPGRVRCEADRVLIELRPFNNRALTRDLTALCARVAQAQPRLPDGRLLTLSVATAERPSLKLYQSSVE